MHLALEIMLQQTRVAQGTPYFSLFQLHFPLFLIWLKQ
jgi:adenine-specific DNA glycosylase